MSNTEYTPVTYRVFDCILHLASVKYKDIKVCTLHLTEYTPSNLSRTHICALSLALSHPLFPALTPALCCLLSLSLELLPLPLPLPFLMSSPPLHFCCCVSLTHAHTHLSDDVASIQYLSKLKKYSEYTCVATDYRQLFSCNQSRPEGAQLGLSPPCVTHTRAHTHITRTHAHAHMHTCTHAHMHTCTHAYMHTCTHPHPHMHTCARARLETYTYNSKTIFCTSHRKSIGFCTCTSVCNACEIQRQITQIVY